jgi:chromatin remodeling complex protein RSC6
MQSVQRKKASSTRTKVENKKVSTKTKSATQAKPKVEPTKNVSKSVPPRAPPVSVDEDTEEKIQLSIPTRKVVDRESVLEGFDTLSKMIETEIQTLRECSQKTKGIKFLRTLNKNIKALRSQSTKVMKKKATTVRKNNNNSGFLKPVPISKEMAQFTGWKDDQLRSRVEVTKYICDYITQNNLQNPEDRRQIIPDDKLRGLLQLNGQEDLRYYSLQTHLKRHFPKPTVVLGSS